MVIFFVPGDFKTHSVNGSGYPKKRQCNPPGREMDALTESWVRNSLSPGLSAQTQAGVLKETPDWAVTKGPRRQKVPPLTRRGIITRTILQPILFPGESRSRRGAGIAKHSNTISICPRAVFEFIIAHLRG